LQDSGLRGAASSIAELGGACELPQLAAATLASLRVWYDALATSSAAVVGAWRSRAAPWWGELVELRTAAGGFEGRLLDVDQEGALLVEAEDGATRRVLSGEVLRLRRKE
jgi:biotin-(acetyl-CoA carboxylase) ligase